MLLYHGSNVEVWKPKLLPARRLLDFGTGFYLTGDLEQAKRWSKRTMKMRETGAPLVSVFDFADASISGLHSRFFPHPDLDWLHYIAANRTGKVLETDYDLVIGPVANDQTMQTINLYLRGDFSDEIAIQLLLPQKLKDQYAFNSERALELLKPLEVIAL